MQNMVALKPLVIRADADAHIGTGHIMRCIALGQAWQDGGGKVVFCMASSFPSLEARLLAEQMEIIHISAKPGLSDDASQTAKAALEMESEWVVVDGYHFGADYQRVIKDSRLRLLFLDDNGHAQSYCADIVLNQNIYACEDFYKSRRPYTELLLGTDYALLRREFLKWSGWRRETPDPARRVLVTLGGIDPDNTAHRVMKWLERVDVNRLEIDVIVGAANPYFHTLQSAARSSRHSIHLEKEVFDMPHRMARSDIAISAAGSTLLELAFMALPTCTVVVAENQFHNARAFHERGDTVELGNKEAMDDRRAAQLIGELIMNTERRREMSRSLHLLVNGLGAVGVLNAISTYKEASHLS